jgi:hypothetical protein
MTLKQQPIVLLPTPPLPHLPLKLLALPLIALPRLLLQLKAPRTRHSPLQQTQRLAAKQTAKAWNVCSRSRCLNKTDLE